MILTKNILYKAKKLFTNRSILVFEKMQLTTQYSGARARKAQEATTTTTATTSEMCFMLHRNLGVATTTRNGRILSEMPE